MSKLFTKATGFVALFLVASLNLIAQTQISGNITDGATKEPLVGVSVRIKGTVTGTISDLKGNFSVTTATKPPFMIEVTSVGYTTQEIKIDGNSSKLAIVLKEQATLSEEVVVSASRVSESVMKSPVSVEKMDIRAIREAAAPSFYDALSNIKGVDMATQGMLFKSVNMRGFGATGNPRTVQMIDGMDNSAPGLNFPTDNIVGMPELDVESVEILPGAASALYGPNAINGLILMNSKTPFLYQGLSANVKTGIMSESSRTVANTGFYDASIRYAKAINNKFAFKINLAYITAKDWQASNYGNLNLGGNSDPTRALGTNINYDGANVYGDENQQNMQTIANSMISAKVLPAAAIGLVPNRSVSRTGYSEVDLVDYNTKSFKFNGALHYRLSEKVELIGQLNYGKGTTVYTGTGRYSLRDFFLTQAKIELKGDNFNIRAYTTRENSGQSYTAGLAAITMNEIWKPSQLWYPQYIGAFVGARSAGQSEDAAHITARGVADTGRPLPGTQAYTDLLDKVRNGSISNPIIPGFGGGGFTDISNLVHAEGVYNFKNQIKFADVLVGANVRQYQLGSDGTLFADKVEGRTGQIKINEYGGFVQVAKGLLNDHLKISGSLRYDKNQNFAGQFTPRVSAVATFGQHNFRLSYQTGFRIPTTQNQYIDLLVPNARLIGGLPEFNKRYNLSNSYSRQDVVAFGNAITATATTPAFQQQAIQALTAQVTPQVVAAVTAAVTAQVQALVAAGQLPAAAAAAAIQQGVAAAAPGEIGKAVTANASSYIQAAAIQANLASLKPYQEKEFKPESVANYEIGYRGTINKRLFVDAYYYYSVYKNFIGGTVLLQPTASIAPGVLPEVTGVLGGGTRKVYSRPANSTEDITASGWAVGLNYRMDKNFVLSGNIANNELNNFTPSAELQTAGFNTPKYRWNVGLSNRSVGGSKIGFNFSFKHQDSFTWEAGFVQPSETGVPLYSNTVVPAINNLDAQVSFKLSKMKSILKVGGSNILGTPYIQAYGNPTIGAMYYVSISFDELLN
jgi:iron complex outermembrane recepter protein